MENNNPNYVYENVIQIGDSASTRKFLAKIFVWMTLGLALSAFCAFEFFLNQNLMQLILDPATGGFTTFGYVTVFAPVAFSLVANLGYNRVSYPVMILFFLAYAATIGISFSVLGLIYTASSIFTVFLSSAVVFAVMAIAGYTTEQDLTKFGSVLRMIFMAAFVVGLINFFMRSSQLDYFLSFIFVATMVGLTAYHVQTLKRIGEGIEYGSDSSKKLTIIGAFVLYTTFVNLFISMLRIFGRRR
jgi:FtsH-binding integral membrane protein